MKIIANYLPQYHSIPENDKWWGEGFTDWVSAKNAKPLFEGHEQPKVPLNENYYDLSDVNSIKWQAKIARKHGVDGFGIYHYWFNSDMILLQKPAELLLNNKDIDIEYMFIWDNSTWARTWKNIPYSNQWSSDRDKINKTDEENGILAELNYGDELDWKKHFSYLLPFFKDERYIKINNRPVFSIFNQDNKPDVLSKMIKTWDELAKENGFDGVMILGRKKENEIKIADYEMNYIPGYIAYQSRNSLIAFIQKVKKVVNRKIGRVNKYNYDTVWKRILDDAEINKDRDVFYSGIVTYDDCPRRGKSGSVFMGATPEKFEKYIYELICKTLRDKKELLFITAWNEWGEGAYLEPDSKNNYLYLEALHNAILNSKRGCNDEKGNI